VQAAVGKQRQKGKGGGQRKAAPARRDGASGRGSGSKQQRRRPRSRRTAGKHVDYHWLHQQLFGFDARDGDEAMAQEEEDEDYSDGSDG
jgi:hypothetical protein